LAPAIVGSSDFWKYTFLALQEDTEDTQSSCASAFEDFDTLYVATNTIISTNADYVEGLSEKGNGTANDVGFFMY